MYSDNPLHDATDYFNRPELPPEERVCEHCKQISYVHDMVHDKPNSEWIDKECLEAWLDNFREDMSAEEFEEMETRLKKQI